MPEVATKWQRFDQLTGEGLYELLAFRQSIFVVEQGSPYPDLDGLDQDAWHLSLRGDAGLVGYLRLIPVPPSVRIGRVAVASHFRRCGLGRRLMEEALLFCRERYAGYAIVLAAQQDTAPFYESFGFAVASEPYDDFDVPHVDMTLLPRI